MTFLYVTEYADTDQGSPMEPPLASQKITFTTTTQSNAFHASTRLIRVHSNGICSVEVGNNPTATTSSKRMALGATEYFAVPGGFKIAAVDNT